MKTSGISCCQRQRQFERYMQQICCLGLILIKECKPMISLKPSGENLSQYFDHIEATRKSTFAGIAGMKPGVYRFKTPEEADAQVEAAQAAVRAATEKAFEGRTGRADNAADHEAFRQALDEVLREGQGSARKKFDEV